MDAQDVEARLEAVLDQLRTRREAAKRTLDEAWQARPRDCDDLLAQLAQAHAQFVDFSRVAERALPLLRSLDQIERLRRGAVEQLDRLAEQAQQSRQIRDGLDPADLVGIADIPPTVGERFDLSLLSDQQLALILEARRALAGSEAEARPPARPPADPPRPLPTLDFTLEELTESLQDSQDSPEPEVLTAPARAPEADPEPPAPAPVGLPGDEELDAMFEEAVTGESAGPEATAAPPDPPPAAAKSPAAAAPTLAEARDPLDELLTRAGFEN